MVNPLALGAALTAPVQGFRFFVMIIPDLGLPKVLDMRFNKVTGLGMHTNVHSFKSGGQNLYEHRFPDGVKYENLILTRGMPLYSPLRSDFDKAMQAYKFSLASVYVFLQDESSLPVAAWQFEKAWPVKWSFSDLDASQSNPVIEHLEFAYERFNKLL
jgi:phage tail-like protein